MQLPPDVQMTREVLPQGHAFVFRHRTLGLLGRLILKDVGPNQMEIRSEVAGVPDDPMTQKRQAVLQPITDMIIQALEQNAGAAPPHPRPPLRTPLVPGGYRDHVIASKLLQCEVCDRPYALLIFADAEHGTLEDHARLMYEHIQQVNLPTFILGPQHPEHGWAEVWPVHPTRQEVELLTEAEFEALIAPLHQACCGTRG